MVRVSGISRNFFPRYSGSNFFWDHPFFSETGSRTHLLPVPLDSASRELQNISRVSGRQGYRLSARGRQSFDFSAGTLVWRGLPGSLELRNFLKNGSHVEESCPHHWLPGKKSFCSTILANRGQTLLFLSFSFFFPFLAPPGGQTVRSAELLFLISGAVPYLEQDCKIFLRYLVNSQRY